MTDFRWTEGGETRSARWRSESGAEPPARGIAAGDTLTADAACRLAREERGILWRGDFQNARQPAGAGDGAARPREPGEARRREP